MRAIRSSFVFVFYLLVALHVSPFNSTAEPSVPALLSPWVEWVRDRHPEWSCADGDLNRCSWPGVVNFSSNNHGATFSINVEILRDGESLPLPSAKNLYPTDIRVQSEDGRPAPVLTSLKDDLLYLNLPIGKFRIAGRFSWDQIPQSVPVPGSYGLVRVSPPAKVHRDNDSFSLEQEAAESQTDHVAIEVVRLVTDGSPVTVETQLLFKVSGRSRTLDLGRIIPEGAVPIVVSSDLAAGVKGDGSLVVQLVPGQFRLSLSSIQPQPVTSIKFPTSAVSFWPQQELLAFRSDNHLRSVQITEGAEPSPGSVEQLPPDWRNDSPFVIEKGATVTLEEIRRGEQSTAPDNVKLHRTLWVDLDGSYFTAVDRFSGELNQNFRFDAAPSNEVGRAESSGKPLMLSIDEDSKLNGVRLVNQSLQMTSVSRIKRDGALSASGWARTVDELNIELNLPPSWKLLHVDGADEVVGSWLSTWSLLTLFITILIVIGAKHLIGFRFAVILGVSLLLNHGEFLAPEIIFIHLLILIVFANLVGDEASVWKRVVRVLTVVAFSIFALQSLAFAKLQFMQLLYPQLQAGTRHRTIVQDLVFMMENSIFSLPLALLFVALIFWCAQNFFKKPSVGTFFVSGFVFFLGAPIITALFGLTSRIDRFEQFSVPASSGYSETSRMQAPKDDYGVQSAEEAAGGDAIHGDYAQDSTLPKSRSIKIARAVSAPKPLPTSLTRSLYTGPAIPDWSWRKFYIRVPGPVDASAELSLYALSPTVVRVFCAVRTLLSLVLIYLMGIFLGLITPDIDRRIRGFLRIAPAAAALLVGVLAIPGVASAEVPSDSLLKELESKLAAERCSEQPCAVIQSANFQLNGNSLVIRMSASSRGVSAVTLPGPLNDFQPDAIKINGKETTSLRRTDGGYLEVKLEDGAAEIEVLGQLHKSSQLALQFTDRPLFATATSPDWDIEGISPSGFISDTLRFVAKIRGAANTSGDDKPSREGLVSWFLVNRDLTIGDSYAATTTVSRLGATDYPATIELPLLGGEKVTSGGVRQEGSRASISFGAGVDNVSFTGDLPKTDLVNYSATKLPRLTERFSVRCDASIRCEFDGVTPIKMINDGVLAPVWQPYPGEEVAVKVSQLTSQPGSSATVDKVQHEISWGSGLFQAELKVAVRTTQQSMFTVRLPGRSELTSAKLNGTTGDGKSADGAHSFLLNPGSHELVLSYQFAWRPGFKEIVPVVGLSAPPSNIQTIVKPSEDRWLLWMGGGYWGPSVVFWGKLIFVCLLCALLGAIGLIPGGVRSGVLLGIGLTSLPLMLIAFPLIWLGILGLQEHFLKPYEWCKPFMKKTALIGIGIVSLMILYGVVQIGLVMDPPMLIAGNQSTSSLLRWYVDHATSELPTPYVISLPLKYWRIFSLVWAGWLAVATIGWLKKSVELFKKI